MGQAQSRNDNTTITNTNIAPSSIIKNNNKNNDNKNNNNNVNGLVFSSSSSDIEDDKIYNTKSTNGRGVGKMCEGSNETCQFFLNDILSIFPGRKGNAPLLSRRGKNDDPMGTPIPDTPIYQRKKRQQVLQEALGNDQQQQHQSHTPNGTNQRQLMGGSGTVAPFTRSSYYSGLEKEISSMSVIKTELANSDADNTNNNNNNNNNNTNVNNENEDPTAQIHDGPHSEQKLHMKYQLLEVLGVGSTSTVHRCVNRSSLVHCACKIIDKQHMEERFNGMLDQFQTEVDALRRLHHPNIIELYDVYITAEKIYIIMELMEGGELFDYVVQKGTLNEEEASRIVRKVTSALVYMHTKDIVHRDLKPENLLLRSKPRTARDIEVKIIDFGLSKAMEEPVARSFLGTRGYIAPEMLQRRDYTRAIDTWALGVIVFVLLCGCLPFDDDSQTVPSDDLVRVRFVLRFPRWANNLSASAKDLLSHLLDVNPRTRYTAEQALYHPWVQGTTAPRDSLLASPGRIAKSPKYNNSRSPYNSKNLMGGGRRGAATAAARGKQQQQQPQQDRNRRRYDETSAAVMQECSSNNNATLHPNSQRIIVRKNSL